MADRSHRPDILTEVVVARYIAGETTVQLATAFNTSPGTINARLQSAGVIRRPRGTYPLDRELTYSEYHSRVRRIRGRPSLCEDCGTTDPDTCYSWASISKRYSDPSDYKRLCQRCHVKFDQIIERLTAAKIGRPRPDVAKLTPAIVREAALRHANGESYCSLGRAFGVHNQTIRQALTGQTWRHVWNRDPVP